MRHCLVAATMLFVATTAHAQDLKSDMLAAHNAERDAVGAPPLQWDDSLATGAQVWADYLADGSSLVHSGGSEGENLWMGTAGAYGHADMTQTWIDEKAWFTDGVFPDISTEGGWSKVGHYSQMIWSGTTHVGCATATGHGWDFLVCRYSPAGNVYGEKTYP